MKQTVILGNIVTVDDKRPFAKAALVKDGVFAYIGDAETAKKLAGDDAKVLDYGEQDGYLCETPLFDVIHKVPGYFEDFKNFLLAWHGHCNKKGYNAVADAGVKLLSLQVTKAYHELENEGKLKLRTYAYLMVPENAENPCQNIFGRHN